VTRRLPHGEVIVRQGDHVSSLFLVTAGAVRLSSVTASGREIVVGLLCRGDLFGESALLGDPSLVRAQAVGPTTVLALPIASMRAMLERTPATAEELLRLIAARLHRTSAALEDAMAADLPSRVVGRLASSPTITACLGPTVSGSGSRSRRTSSRGWWGRRANP